MTSAETAESACTEGAIADQNWAALEARLNAQSNALIAGLLDRSTCRRLAAAYTDPGVAYRTTVDMARFQYGRGQYRYFSYPLPAVVALLRAAFYPHLAKIANRWSSRFDNATVWPLDLETLTKQCHAAGQSRPTPLLLRYGAGDYNCLHQDVYGAVQFPLQVIVLLSEPGGDFEGGELVLTEQRARRQSRPIVVPLGMGDAAIVPVSQRPEPGRAGYRRVTVRHGVSEVRTGERTSLGLIFHDAA